MKTKKQTIGQRIKELRESRGLTQSQLAEELNFSDKTVSKWEKDGTEPDSETLVWHVGQVATSYVGNGKIELQWHPDGAAKKSAQFDVVVLGTIGKPVSEIPDAQRIYLDVMQGIADHGTGIDTNDLFFPSSR